MKFLKSYIDPDENREANRLLPRLMFEGLLHHSGLFQRIGLTRYTSDRYHPRLLSGGRLGGNQVTDELFLGLRGQPH